MNYIDKIKKDGIVYQIKGAGGGSGGGVSNVLEVSSADKTEYNCWEFEIRYLPGMVNLLKIDDEEYYPICLSSDSTFFGAWFEATSESSADFTTWCLRGKYLFEFYTSVSFEVDAETGDSHVVVGEAYADQGFMQYIWETYSDLSEDVSAEDIMFYAGSWDYISGQSLRELLESLDSEMIKKLIGEPQVI